MMNMVCRLTYMNTFQSEWSFKFSSSIQRLNLYTLNCNTMILWQCWEHSTKPELNKCWEHPTTNLFLWHTITALLFFALWPQLSHWRWNLDTDNHRTILALQKHHWKNIHCSTIMRWLLNIDLTVDWSYYVENTQLYSLFGSYYCG